MDKVSSVIDLYDKSNYIGNKHYYNAKNPLTLQNKIIKFKFFSKKGSSYQVAQILLFNCLLANLPLHESGTAKSENREIFVDDVFPVLMDRRETKEYTIIHHVKDLQ